MNYLTRASQVHDARRNVLAHLHRMQVPTAPADTYAERLMTAGLLNQPIRTAVAVQAVLFQYIWYLEEMEQGQATDNPTNPTNDLVEAKAAWDTAFETLASNNPVVALDLIRELSVLQYQLFSEEE